MSAITENNFENVAALAAQLNTAYEAASKEDAAADLKDVFKAFKSEYKQEISNLVAKGISAEEIKGALLEANPEMAETKALSAKYFDENS